MTFDFSHLKQFDIAAARREYVFRGIVGNPTLVCSPATHWRPEFERAVRDMDLASGAKAGARDKKVEITLEAIVAERRAQVPLYAEHVVRDWRNVTDSSGAPVPCSRDAVVAFLLALPDLMLAEFQTWAITLDNFRDVYDGEAVAKN